jgi:phage FluMu protein Com
MSLIRGKQSSAEEQFDGFWEMKCPKCGEKLNLEIILNAHSKK